MQEERSIDNKDTAIIEGFADSGDAVDAFWNYFGGKLDEMPPDIASNDAKGADEEKENANVTPSVNRVNDDSGTVEINQVAQGNYKFKKSVLDSKDCFVVDLGYSIYIWIGSASSKAEKREAMKYALKYCVDSGRSTNIPIVRVNEGNEPEEFLSAFVSEKQVNKDDGDEKDYENVKRHWDLAMSFDAKNRLIVMKVTDKVSEQEFEKIVGSDDCDGKDIVEVYKEIAKEVGDGNVKYTFDVEPPLGLVIGGYNFSLPAN